MELIEQELSKEYSKSSKFFIEDLKNIYNELNKVFEEVEINTDTCKNINNIEDLKNKNIEYIRFNCLMIKKNGYYISTTVEIEKDTMRINCNDKKNLILRGLFSLIEDIFFDTRRKLNFLYLPTLPFFYHILLVSLIFIISVNIISFLPDYDFLKIIPFVLFIFYPLYKPTLKSKNIFILDKNKNEYSFYKEYKDWIINFVNGGVLLLITEIIKYYINKT